MPQPSPRNPLNKPVFRLVAALAALELAAFAAVLFAFGYEAVEHAGDLVADLF